MSLTVPVQEIVTGSNDSLLAIHSSWERVPLDSIAEILNGFAFKSAFFSKLKGKPLLRIRDVGKDRTESFYKGAYEPRYIVREGDLIVGMDGDFKCGCWKGPDALLNQRVCKIELMTRNYELGFLNLALPGYLRAINERTSSQTVRHLSSKSIAEIPLPLPPLAEQKRIVAKVEELLRTVDATKERLAKVALILKRFRQAVLTAACSGRLTADWREENQMEDVAEGSELPPRWRWIQIKELLPPGGIFDGPFGSNLKTADYTDNGVRVVRLENVGSLQFFNQKEAYISQEKYKSLSKHTVGAGDIIFASFIDEEVRACVLPKLKTMAIAKADCFCVRPRQDVVDRHYLTLQLVSRDSYEQLSENIHGATRPRVNTTQLRNLEVRICPLTEQQEIVRRVESMFKLAGVVEKRVAVAKSRAEKLTQAILAKAFRGELVPTEAELARREGRSYKSASELLARIKSERETNKVATSSYHGRVNKRQVR